MTKGEKALAQARAMQASGAVGRYEGTSRKGNKPAQVTKVIRGHDATLTREVNKMAKEGYYVETINGRKALFSATAGIFTRKQVWTVVFRKA